jgi:myo-inositol-1(or 4)-monophosphatase
MPEAMLALSGRPALEVATDLAKQAGRILLANFSKEKQVTHKGRGNVVTNVDLLSEALLVTSLRQEFPSLGILSEETNSVLRGNADLFWVVDPLDGSRNYASGVPIFSVSIALATKADVLLGVTYDPTRGELFTAERGKGAYLNGQRIHVSQKRTLKEALPGMDMGYEDDRARLALQMVTALWPGMQSLRVMGSSTLGLCYAAAGRLDIYFHHNLAPWDMASGIVLVKEAGGTITDKQGSPITLFSGTVIASNAAIHADFLRLTEGMEWRKA